MQTESEGTCKVLQGQRHSIFSPALWNQDSQQLHRRSRDGTEPTTLPARSGTKPGSLAQPLRGSAPRRSADGPTAPFLHGSQSPGQPLPRRPPPPAARSLTQGELRSALCQGSLPALANGSYASEPSLEASFYCFPNTAGSAQCTFSGLLCGGCSLEIEKGRDT